MRGGHENGTRRVGPYAAEKTRGAFCATHLHQAVERVAVVSSLRRGQSSVGLHAHVQNVCRVSCDSAQEARGTGHSNQSEKAGRRVGSREPRFELLVDTEAGGRIRDLSQEGCRQLQKITISIKLLLYHTVLRATQRIRKPTPLYKPKNPSFLNTWAKVPTIVEGAPGPRVCRRTC